MEWILGFYLVFFLLAIVTSIFWIWMLIAALTREPDPSEKIVWVLVILFLHFLGALLYFFIRYNKMRSGQPA